MNQRPEWSAAKKKADAFRKSEERKNELKILGKKKKQNNDKKKLTEKYKMKKIVGLIILKD